MARILKIETRVIVIHNDGTPVEKIITSSPIACADEMVPHWDKKLAKQYADQMRPVLAGVLLEAFVKPEPQPLILDALGGLAGGTIVDFNGKRKRPGGN